MHTARRATKDQTTSTMYLLTCLVKAKPKKFNTHQFEQAIYEIIHTNTYTTTTHTHTQHATLSFVFLLSDERFNLYEWEWDRQSQESETWKYILLCAVCAYDWLLLFLSVWTTATTSSVMWASTNEDNLCTYDRFEKLFMHGACFLSRTHTHTHTAMP